MKRLVLLLALCCGKLPQPDVCKQYVSCNEAVDPTTYRSTNNLYGPNGTCWQTNQQTADTCEKVCARDLATLSVSDAGFIHPECAFDAGP